MSRPFTLEPFRPAHLWSNAHVQTVLANGLRSRSGVAFRRFRLDTPDGDFLDLDFAAVAGHPLPSGAPLVLLLHGLEGSARRGYACETYRQLAQRGVAAVGLNFRSCSGEMNRTARFYHAGETADVAFVVRWLAEQFPDVPLGLIGFSLGGNTALKYLGEQGTATPVRAAAAVSPPFNLTINAPVFDSGSGRFYRRFFLHSLRRKVRRHAALIGEKVDVDAVLHAPTVRAFDDTLTAPLHGFRDAADYYAQSSSGQFLPGVRVPTLLLRALDDPFFGSDAPRAAIAANPDLVPGFVAHGGHVGFVEGRWPWRFHYWAERQAARFLAQQLHE